MAKHECPNRFGRDGARGGSFFQIDSNPDDPEGFAYLEVGHSCVIVFRGEIPITWLSELIAIATEHKDGIAGFLRDHNWSGESYALMCDPEKEPTP